MRSPAGPVNRCVTIAGDNRNASIIVERCGSRPAAEDLLGAIGGEWCRAGPLVELAIHLYHRRWCRLNPRPRGWRRAPHMRDVQQIGVIGGHTKRQLDRIAGAELIVAAAAERRFAGPAAPTKDRLPGDFTGILGLNRLPAALLPVGLILEIARGLGPAQTVILPLVPAVRTMTGLVLQRRYNPV